MMISWEAGKSRVQAPSQLRNLIASLLMLPAGWIYWIWICLGARLHSQRL